MAAPQRGGGGFPGRDLRVGEGSEVKLDEASASELPMSRPWGEPMPPMTRQAATDGGLWGPVAHCAAGARRARLPQRWRTMAFCTVPRYGGARYSEYGIIARPAACRSRRMITVRAPAGHADPRKRTTCLPTGTLAPCRPLLVLLNNMHLCTVSRAI